MKALDKSTLQSVAPLSSEESDSNSPAADSKESVIERLRAQIKRLFLHCIIRMKTMELRLQQAGCKMVGSLSC